MASLRSIVDYADRFLRIKEVNDWPNAWNGLQIENSGTVTKIGAAVDACEPVIARAVEQGITFLLVHHGLFWNGVQPLVGAAYRKTQLAVTHGLAIYSAHLPLDLHPLVGNNILLCKALGFTRTKPFFMEKGEPIGLRVELELPLRELARRLEKALGSAPHLCPGGPATTKHIGVVTGGAGAEVARAAAEGVDTFITGEGPHWSYTAAEEIGMNVFYGGHYATETFGVKALAAQLARRFRVPWEFLDHPTGL